MSFPPVKPPAISRPDSPSAVSYWQPGGSLDAAAIHWLQANLPEFVFNWQVPAAADDFARSPQLHAYLDFYRLNFAPRYSARHQLGRLDWRGYRIALQAWQPLVQERAPRGSLLLMHGYYDHAGIFAKAIEFALAQNLAVLIFDLPGHGLSSGERSAIDSFDTYADLLAEVLGRALPQLPSPCYALGQSTGGAILLNHLWRYPEQSAQLDKIALCAPLILPRGWGAGRWLYHLLKPLVRRIKRSRSLSSHDLAFVRFIDEQDPLQDNTLPLSWVGAMKAWNAGFRQMPLNPRELLVIQGTGDLTVNWRYNLTLLQQKLPNAKIEYLPDAGHQLVNESDNYRLPLFARLASYFSAN